MSTLELSSLKYPLNTSWRQMEKPIPFLVAALSCSLKIQEHCCIGLHVGRCIHKQKRNITKGNVLLIFKISISVSVKTCKLRTLLHCKTSISTSLQWISQHNLKTTVICGEGTDIAIAVEDMYPTTLKLCSTNSCGVHHFISARKISGFKA